VGSERPADAANAHDHTSPWTLLHKSVPQSLLLVGEERHVDVISMAADCSGML
jgi:hypothetical protein